MRSRGATTVFDVAPATAPIPAAIVQSRPSLREEELGIGQEENHDVPFRDRSLPSLPQ
jgi:hypothetical protein